MLSRLLTSPVGANRRVVATLITCTLLPASALAACSGDDDDSVGLDETIDGGTTTEDEASTDDPDVGPGDGVVGTGTLTVTLDDSTTFEFTGDCEVVVEPSSTRFFFQFEDSDGQLASANHIAGDGFGNPTSVQYTDDDLWLYRGSSYSNTTTDGPDWSSDVIIEALIDGEPFSSPGRGESACS